MSASYALIMVNVAEGHRTGGAQGEATSLHRHASPHPGRFDDAAPVQATVRQAHSGAATAKIAPWA
jgi:hypothetical protein